jgi:hypothetical protein
VHRGVLASEPSAPVLCSPSIKGLNVSEPTTPAGTPAAGRPFPAIRRRLTPSSGRGVVCDECGTTYDPGAERCPTCVQRRRRPGGGLEAVTETFDGDRPWTPSSAPTPSTAPANPDIHDDDAEGWPW